MLYYTTLHHAALCCATVHYTVHTTLHHATLYYTTHLTVPDYTTTHHTTPHNTMLHYLIHDTIWHQTTPCQKLYNTTPQYTMYTTPNYTMPHLVWYYITLYYAKLYYATLQLTTLHHTAWHHSTHHTTDSTTCTVPHNTTLLHITLHHMTSHDAAHSLYYMILYHTELQHSTLSITLHHSMLCHCWETVLLASGLERLNDFPALCVADFRVPGCDRRSPHCVRGWKFLPRRHWASVSAVFWGWCTRYGQLVSGSFCKGPEVKKHSSPCQKKWNEK